MAGSRYDTFLPIPLGYIRMRNGASVTGLTISVVVVSAVAGASLLSTTSVPEVGSGSGLYTYNWNSSILVTTECVATYTVIDSLGTKTYKEHFTISNSTDAIESDVGKTV